jgi:uncharacterized membrane protein YagU involved in acid resistance
MARALLMVLPLLRGAAAGVVATIAMSVPMVAARRIQLLDRQPPEEVTQELASDAGVSVRGPVLPLATVMAHVAFGASAGAIFALARPRVGPPSAGPWVGSAYGVLIWVLTYRGILPRLGLIRSAEQAGSARDLVMLWAHLVYGAVLGWLSGG